MNTDGELEKILQEFIFDHDDNDHNTCASQYVVCSVCGDKRYWANMMRYECNHTPVSDWRKQPCDCHVKDDLNEAKQAINKHALETAMRLIGDNEEYVTRDSPADPLDEQYYQGRLTGCNLLRQDLRKAFKEEYK